MRLSHKLLLAAPVLFLLYFYDLAGVGMLGPDEPRYAAIGREMALTGDWVTPRLWGQPWFEKPALLYWLTATGWLAGLGPDLAPRLPVAAVSVAFLIFFFFTIRREFGETAGWYATAVLATSGGWLAYSRVAVTDLPLSASFGTAMLLALSWLRSGARRTLAIAGVFLGLAMLAKGLVPVVLAAPLLWVGRRRPLDLLAMGLAALAVATPWYLQVWRVNGGAFIDEFFWKHHFARLVSEEIQHAQPWWFFVPVLLGLLFPWSPALAALRGLDWSELRRLLLLLWAAWGLLFFSAATNKLPGYILPLLPAFAALIGIGCARKVPRYAVAACALLVALVPVAAGVLPTAILEGLSRAAISDIPWLAVALVLVAAAGVGFFSQAPVLPTAALMAAAVLWLVYSAFPALDRTASGRAWWLNASTAGDVFCVDTEHRGVRYGVFYYAGRELPACTASRERNHVNLDRDLGETR